MPLNQILLELRELQLLNTPEAPNVFKTSSLTIEVSLTSTLNLVIQESRDKRFSFPPKASKTPTAKASPSTAFVSSESEVAASLPGVF